MAQTDRRGPRIDFDEQPECLIPCEAERWREPLVRAVICAINAAALALAPQLAPASTHAHRGPKNAMSAPVFISHSSRDYVKSRTLTDALEGRGVKCWISERDIGAGDNYGDAIVDALERAQVMVLVFSENANNSEEIKKEIAIASQRKIIVIPVRIEDVAPSKAYRYELATRNWIDLFADWDSGLQRLIARIAAVDATFEPTPSPAPAPNPAPPKVPRWLYATLPILALAAAGGYFWQHPRPIDKKIVVGDNLENAPVPKPTPVVDNLGLDGKNEARPAPPPTPTATVAPEPTAAASPTAPRAPSPAPTPPLEPSPTTSSPEPANPTTIDGAEAAPAALPAMPAPPPTILGAPSPPPPQITEIAKVISTPTPAGEPASTSTPAPNPIAAATAPTPPPIDSAASASAPALAIGPPPSAAAGTVFKECDKCPEMIIVARGAAMLGSAPQEASRQANESPMHEVDVAEPFAVGRFAITFDEWDACLADGGCNARRPGDFGWGRGRQPVIFVSWKDADAYVAWLKKKTGRPYRLLSEAEWEYAARGCATMSCPNIPFWFGQIRPELAHYDARFAYEGSPKANSPHKAAPADDGAPNPFGLVNILGNVRQWVADCWNPTPVTGRADAAARVAGDCASRAVKGGSWADKPQDLRAAARSWETIDQQSPNIGFRVARTLEH